MCLIIFRLEKDSSDDERDLFSSDHLTDGKQSFEFYNYDQKFKSGDEDFKIITGLIFLKFLKAITIEKKKNLENEEKKVISRNIPIKKK